MAAAQTLPRARTLPSTPSRAAGLIKWLPLLAFLLVGPGCAGRPAAVPDDFVDLQSFVPGIRLEVRYAGSDNFLGRPVAGYQAPRAYLLRPAASALRSVQQELADSGLGLKVFDGYRPQRAVDDFVRWARDLEDTRMKERYYPNVDKANLFRDGYIAACSGHSRGSTVDLTLVRLADGAELDMGTGWDFFDPRSWPSSTEVSQAQRANRLLLQQLMVRHGFQPLAEEWWHFSLVGETYPDRYFDFPIERIPGVGGRLQP